MDLENKKSDDVNYLEKQILSDENREVCDLCTRSEIANLCKRRCVLLDKGELVEDTNWVIHYFQTVIFFNVYYSHTDKS